MSGSSQCVVCHRSFGAFLWKHECTFCHNKVCDDCAPKRSGRRQCTACAMGQGSAEEEREKRMRAIQGRMQTAEQRGRPQVSNGAPAPRPQPQQCVAPAGPEASRPEAQAMMMPQGSNPMLEAAMRRQQQEKEKGRQGGSHGNSSEKAQLIAEIVALLNSRREEEPFGLRSMDETKLRLYLRHVKEKK